MHTHNETNLTSSYSGVGECRSKCTNASRHEYRRIAASYNIPIFMFYDRLGFRRDEKIAELLECNQPHFKRYAERIKDDLKTFSKSKRANAHVLDSLID